MVVRRARAAADCRDRRVGAVPVVGWGRPRAVYRQRRRRDADSAREHRDRLRAGAGAERHASEWRATAGQAGWRRGARDGSLRRDAPREHSVRVSGLGAGEFHRARWVGGGAGEDHGEAGRRQRVGGVHHNRGCMELLVAVERLRNRVRTGGRFREADACQRDREGVSRVSVLAHRVPRGRHPVARRCADGVEAACNRSCATRGRRRRYT